MLKNTLNKFAKGSPRKFKSSSFEKRMMVIDSVMNEQKNKEYNPRKARNRSLKGIVFTSK
jgi:hypothetical protein